MKSTAHNQVLIRAIANLESLHRTCKEAAMCMDQTSSNRIAFERDARFLNESITALRSGECEQIQSVWERAQHLSRFLGGDYIRSSRLNEKFESGCAEVFETTLELIQLVKSETE
jgi:hypothetical protein